MISKENLEMICEMAAKHGIKVFHDNEVRLVFSGTHGMGTHYETFTNPIGEKHGMPTEDELLFASSIPLTEEEIMARPPA